MTGEYVADSGECVFLSVPYTEGMRLKINGKRAELYEVYDGFTAFYLEKGANEIKLSFRPKGIGFGAIGALLGAVGVALLFVLEKRKGAQLALPNVANVVAYVGVFLAGIAVICAVYLFPLLLCSL